MPVTPEPLRPMLPTAVALLWCLQPAQADTPQFIEAFESGTPSITDYRRTDVPPGGLAQAAPASPAAPASDDLLVQIPAGFVLPHRETRAVEAEFDWYLRNPDYLDRVFQRGRPFLPHIVEQLRARGMPLELALLPVVESAFDPFAYSHGQAAGLWQFIPATGRRFGLQQNWWYDGRRDVIESTRAALDYLQRLHGIFRGDWLLAIAAYNSGEGKVRRAIRRAGPLASFWDLRLPRETESYVPRLLALSRIVAAPADFGVVLPTVPDLPRFEVVPTGGQIDLALAAELLPIDIDALYRLNPGLNRWATPPEGPHRLLVPLAAADEFRERLAALPADQRVRWTRYRIENGDTISEIAARHRVTTTTLREANQLRGSTIRSGDYLLIPTASRPPGSYTLSADTRLANRLTSQDALRYTVRAGDSFWSIARRYGVGVRELARWNGMAPRDTLKVGRQLVIRGVADDTEAAPPAATRRIHYTVRKGDSLARISSKFRVSITELRRWNRSIASQKYLFPGQRLVMYIDVRKQSGG